MNATEKFLLIREQTLANNRKLKKQNTLALRRGIVGNFINPFGNNIDVPKEEKMKKEEVQKEVVIAEKAEPAYNIKLVMKALEDKEKSTQRKAYLKRLNLPNVPFHTNLDEPFQFKRVEYFEPIESNDLIEPILHISLNEMELLAKEIAFADMRE